MAIATDSLVPVTGAGQLFPVPTSQSTIWRWVLRGHRGIKLSTVMVGGRRYVNQSMVDDFIRATTVAANGPNNGVTDSGSAAQFLGADPACELPDLSGNAEDS